MPALDQADTGAEGECGEEAQAEEDAEGGDGELAEERGGEGDGFAAETEAGFDDLLPGVDVVLVLAGEELAHLGVDAVDVGDEREDGEEDGEQRWLGRASCAASLYASWMLGAFDEAVGELEFACEVRLRGRPFRRCRSRGLRRRGGGGRGGGGSLFRLSRGWL